MKLAFYPGCSLEGMAKDYSRSVVAVFEHLDIELVEIDDWSCCGATAAHSLDEMMAVALPARNLAAAENLGLDMMTSCANCFNRLRFSQKKLREKAYDVPWPVNGEVQVRDMTRLLAEPQMLERIKQRAVRLLGGMKMVCYYGCQMVRPPKITGTTDYENPQTLDRIADAVGAEVLDWSYKSTCCGASIGIGRKEIQDSLTRRLLAKARQTGAEAIVVSCPLCQANLDMIQRGGGRSVLPVFYVTELLTLAFGDEKSARHWFKMRFADPLPLLAARGLLT
jgi:heterodisulfide reductase subunit B